MRPECITALATCDTTFNGGSHRFDRQPFRLQLLAATRTCDTSAVPGAAARVHRRVGRRDYFDRVDGQSTGMQSSEIDVGRSARCLFASVQGVRSSKLLLCLRARAEPWRDGGTHRLVTDYRMPTSTEGTIPRSGFVLRPLSVDQGSYPLPEIGRTASK